MKNKIKQFIYKFKNLGNEIRSRLNQKLRDMKLERFRLYLMNNIRTTGINADDFIVDILLIKLSTKDGSEITSNILQIREERDIENFGEQITHNLFLSNKLISKIKKVSIFNCAHRPEFEEWELEIILDKNAFYLPYEPIYASNFCLRNIELIDELLLNKLLKEPVIGELWEDAEENREILELYYELNKERI